MTIYVSQQSIDEEGCGAFFAALHFFKYTQ